MGAYFSHQQHSILSNEWGKKKKKNERGPKVGGSVSHCKGMWGTLLPLAIRVTLAWAAPPHPHTHTIPL